MKRPASIFMSAKKEETKEERKKKGKEHSRAPRVFDLRWLRKPVSRFLLPRYFPSLFYDYRAPSVDTVRVLYVRFFTRDLLDYIRAFLHFKITFVK